MVQQEASLEERKRQRSLDFVRMDEVASMEANEKAAINTAHSQTNHLSRTT